VSFYETAVGTNVLIAADDFETDQGWTVEDDPGLATGSWERGIPINDNRGDPPTDFDGSGRCYVTGNTDDEDVDSGYTRLISPAFDLSGLDPEIHYALWYSNNFGSDPNNDLFITEVSNDDGANWVTAETIGPVAGGGWQLRSFRVADFVAPTSAVRVRFEASDFNLGSVVEAAVDAFSITRFECVDPCLADLDGDGEVGIDDFLIVVGAWGTPGGDATGDGETDIDDFLLVLSAWGPCDG
jgi:hypothetical protein